MVESEKSAESASPASASPASASAGSSSSSSGRGPRAESPPPSASAARPRSSVSRDRLLRRGLNLLSALVRLITLLFAVVLVAYVVFVNFGANPANPWAVFVSVWAHRVNLGLDTLFKPGDPKIAVLVNYGLAAVIWLVIRAVVGRVLRRR